MFEGKHIHFSPVDNKPLCSFSNKLCRQRRLNGYAFCIRHILEDKSAPFKRCTYVTRNNNQICQNAIPTNQERGYCHSHMQVAGIIPKTERKQKNAPKITEIANGTTANNKSDSNSSSSSSSAVEAVKKDPNAVFKFEEEHSEIQWIPKGGSINGLVNGGKASSKGKELQTPLKRETNGNGIINGNIYNGETEPSNNSKKPELKNGKVKSSILNGNAVEKSPKSRQISRKNNTASATGKSKSATVHNTQTVNKLTSSLPEHLHRDTGSNTEDLKDTVVPHCASENGKYFEQFTTLKSVEKSITESDLNSQNLISHAKASSTASVQTPIPNSVNIQDLNTSVGNLDVVDFFNTINAQRLSGFWFPPDVTAQNAETRQEFLARVRNAFKSQYLTIKNAAKDSDKNEKIWKRALRNSLLTCVVKDSSYCAHVIVQNDPTKYSDSNHRDNLKASQDTAKHKRTTTSLNGTRVKKGRKLLNGMHEDDVSSDGKSPQLSKSKAVIPNGNLTISKLPSDPSEKVKLKASKRIPVQANVEKGEIKVSSQNKKKSRQSGYSGGDLLNGNSRVQNQFKTQTRSISNNNNKDSMKSKDPDSSGSADISSSAATKKRKFDIPMDSTATFRIPKIEDSSSLNDMDIKMENGHGHLAYNNFNGHISNHPLLHSRSSTAKSPANAQVELQHILSQPDLRTLASNRNQGMDTVLNSVGSSDMGTSDGVITDASFDSTFDHSASSQQDCEFSDDDLEKSLEFQIDPETEHQASRLLEDNELTEDDLNELFPETRISDNKLGRSDLSDLGVDFTSTFDANDIDYSLFANIFPFNRSNQSESISVTNQF